MYILSRCLILLLGPLSALLPAAEVHLSVAEPSGVARSSWPVTSGIPFGRGVLLNTNHLALSDAEGQPVPLQTESLAKWSDGSIRWLLLDFPVTVAANKSAQFRLRFDGNVQADAPAGPLAMPLSVGESEGVVDIDTGVMRLQVSKRRFRLLDRVWLDTTGDGEFSDEERITASQGAGIELNTPDGQVFRADSGPCQVTIEQRGPIRACLRIEGDHRGPSGKMFRFIVRLHAWRGQPYVKLHYTFINDNRRQLMTRIKSLDLVFSHRRIDGGQQGFLNGEASPDARVLQMDDRGYKINSDVTPGHAQGWGYLGDRRGGFAVGIREFWQNWPKSLEVVTQGNARQRIGQDNDATESGPVDRGQLRVGILPEFPQGLYDGKPLREEAKLYYYLRGGVYSFKIGAARTHETWVRFSVGMPDRKRLGSFFEATEKPLLATCDPAYVRKTLAAGDLAVANRKATPHFGYDAWINEFLDCHLEDRRKQRSFGMLNYGDWYWASNDSWGNLEYDMPRCFFAQYLRSGDRRFFDRAEQAARHYIDVDVAHEVNKQLLAYGGSYRMSRGSIWAHSVGHTGGYYGRWDGKKYHDLAKLGSSAPYQLGLSDLGHHWMGGEFDYYCLTGDRRALEVARMASDSVERLCPTAYTDHIRGIGWPLNMMLDAYDATADPKYLAAAKRQWEQLRDHLDPRKGFQVMLAFGHCNEQSPAKRCYGQNAYMLGLTLGGVVRYHQITGDPEVLAGLTAGVKQLIRECYSEKHKSFYLTSCTCLRDRPPPKVSATTFLAAFALAYESEITGNAEHRRILRESLKSGITEGRREIVEGKWQGWSGAHSLCFRFATYALSVLEDDK